MHATALFDLLLHETLLVSLAASGLMLLRPLLLRTAGAQATYLAWLLVPLMMSSPWLPLPNWPEAGQALASAVPSSATAPWIAETTRVVAGLPPDASAGRWAPAGLALWALGAALLLSAQILLQRRYLARLVRDPAGRWSAPAGSSPAVVGLWPQRLVLPQDFEARFDAGARRLVLAHEAVHARRRDNFWTLLATALLSLQWFNPIAWAAWRRLRDDQELACDAAVLRAEASPDAAACYARAMLSAHVDGPGLVLASAWTTRHPLVQRLAQLHRHRRASRARRVLAMLAVLGLGSGSAWLAAAAQQGLSDSSQQLVFDVSSQWGQRDWAHHSVALPLPVAAQGNPAQLTAQLMQPGWCLYLTLYRFADLSVRVQAQAMDASCQQAVGELQTLPIDRRMAQWNAPTADGPLQVQLSAHWGSAPRGESKDEAALDLQLSEAQRQQLSRQRQEFKASQQQLQAQDEAWRAAQAGTR